jgi:hypothetical protein
MDTEGYSRRYMEKVSENLSWLSASVKEEDLRSTSEIVYPFRGRGRLVMNLAAS